MTPHLSNNLPDHKIGLDELASLARELQLQAANLEKAQFLEPRRLCLYFSTISLIIDWHPLFAYCLLIQKPVEAFLAIKSQTQKQINHLEEIKRHNWQQRLHHLKLQKAWASKEGSLHLQFEIPATASLCQLCISLHTKKPNLYWIHNDLEESFLTSLYQRPKNLTELESVKRYDYAFSYEQWKKFYSLYQKHLQAQAIEKHYEPLIQALEKKRQKITLKLQTLNQEDELIHQGQLLQAHCHLYQKGLQSIEVYDWKLDTMRTIPLNEEPIQEQIKNFFHRAKGMRAHQEQLNQQLKVLECKLKNYKDEYARDLTSGALSAQVPFKTPFPVKNQEQKAKPYRLFSYQDAKIYVGKKAQDNLVVSFHIAHGNDLWLHVADYPGSHVVVKAGEITPSILKAASLLAHHYSQARKHKNIEVTYTQAKWLKKLPGSKLGTVGVLQSKRYLSHYDEYLIKQLLESL